MSILGEAYSLTHFWELRLIRKGTTTLIPLFPWPHKLGISTFAVSPKIKESIEKGCIHPAPVTPASRPHSGYLTCAVLSGLFPGCLVFLWNKQPLLCALWPQSVASTICGMFVGGSAHVGRLGDHACAHKTLWSAGKLGGRSREVAMAQELRGALPQLPCSIRNVEESKSPNFRLPGLPGHEEGIFIKIAR